MSNLLSFITSFGSSAELRSLNAEDLRQRMEQHGLTEQEIQVILSGDRNAIATLVKSGGDIVCCVIPQTPDEEDEPEEDDDKKEELRIAL